MLAVLRMIQPGPLWIVAALFFKRGIPGVWITRAGLVAASSGLLDHEAGAHLLPLVGLGDEPLARVWISGRRRARPGAAHGRFGGTAMISPLSLAISSFGVFLRRPCRSSALAS